ncbi:PREDICTED: uncharacterized protein LOC109161836 [Ipomoea nil]|uniref:uncharacterized protein LOC109161836 n=1 Tax=Ipomoea nil TaxID=35883 RepID=UPI000900DA3A|nr:PREDICTED: uncharacterized protein LOC109161836 [Ipomoea nil]
MTPSPSTARSPPSSRSMQTRELMMQGWITIMNLKEAHITNLLASKEKLHKAVGKSMDFIAQAQDSLQHISQELEKMNIETDSQSEPESQLMCGNIQYHAAIVLEALSNAQASLEQPKAEDAD